MSNMKNFAINIAKEITIAKLSTTSPSASNKAAGENISEMFEAIYNKVYEICSNETK